LIHYISLIIFLIIPFGQSIEAQSQVNQLFELGHLEGRFAGSQLLIQDLVVQLAQTENQRPIIDVLADSFDDQQMRDWAIESLSRNLKTTTADSVLAFSDSTNFNHFIELIYANEVDFDDEDIQSDFEAYIIKLENSADSELRFSIIERIMNTTRLIPITVQMLEDVLSVVVFGLNVTLDESERLTNREINELIITLRANFRELFNNVLPVTTLYATRALSIEELESYTRFMESKTGQWFLRTGNTATLDSFGAFAQQTSEYIAKWALEQNETEPQE